jgi:hypothetical protein
MLQRPQGDGGEALPPVRWCCERLVQIRGLPFQRHVLTEIVNPRRSRGHPQGMGYLARRCCENPAPLSTVEPLMHLGFQNGRRKNRVGARFMPL